MYFGTYAVEKLLILSIFLIYFVIIFFQRGPTQHAI